MMFANRGPEDNTDQTAVASHTNNYGASVAPTSTATHPALARPDVGYVVGMQTTRQLEEMAYYTTVESSHRRYTEKYVPTMTWKESRRDWSSEEQRKVKRFVMGTTDLVWPCIQIPLRQ